MSIIEHEHGKSTGFLKKTPLWIQIFIGLVLGAIVGLVFPAFAKELAPIGNAFIKAIKMIVIPLVFSAVTLGIYTMGSNLKELGRLGAIAFVWFYVATGIAIALGITLNEIFHPAAGIQLQKTGNVPANLATSINWVNFFLDIIPANAVDAMANQKIIPTLFFAVCFGLALSKAGEAGKSVVKILEGILATMFKLTQGIVNTAPLAVFALIGWVISTQGYTLLLAMAKLIGVMYIGLACMALVFLIIVKLLGFHPIEILKKIMEPLLLAFSTASSEVTLPVHMKILEATGIPNKVVSFVLPLGYSFNLDGAAFGQAMYTCFLAEAYGINLTLPAMLTILITALIANKGTANVPGASLVVMAVLLTSLGLPVEAIAIIAGIDRFGDMGRTTINVFGNTVAALALWKWGGAGISDVTAETEAA
jgi:DAACS family dicarboxylate/amino acid:cation (Na+ or H+) symporter